MELQYNIFFEVAVIPLDIIICTFLCLRHTRKTKTNVSFKRFAFVLTFATIFDVATAIVTSAKGLVPNAVHYFFNTTDSLLASISGIMFILYMFSYVRGEFQARYVELLVLIVLNFMLLITNPVTKLVFEYDQDGNYIHKQLFDLVAYLFPIVFFAFGSIYMFMHWRRYRKTQIRTMIIAIVIAGTLFLFQMLFFDNTLITYFVASLGLLIMYFSLETPYYERLLNTMEQLQESRAKEAASAAKERLSKEVMLALSQAVDAKDHYTNGHSARVAVYAKEIARRLGMSEKEQDDIYCMGLLHDVGKVGIRDDILNKEGKLTKEEFDAIKSHTVMGYDILKNITEIPGLSTGARWHHEKYDGSGYPDGLKGKEIPLEARIICVADCYDAMTSRRSYSAPKEQQYVRREFVRCQGTHFDPKIADAMVSLIDDDKDYQLREFVPIIKKSNNSKVG